MLVQNYYAFASQTFFAPIFLIQNFQNMSKQNQNISNIFINKKKTFLIYHVFFFYRNWPSSVNKIPQKDMS